MSAKLGDFAEGTSLCVKCGYSHAADFRRRILRRLLASPSSPHAAAEIAAAWPCFWGPSAREQALGNHAGRILYRDLRAVGVQEPDSYDWRLA